MAPRAIRPRGVRLPMAKDEHGEEGERVARDEEKRADRDQSLEGAAEKKEAGRDRTGQQRGGWRSPRVDAGEASRSEAVLSQGESDS